MVIFFAWYNEKTICLITLVNFQYPTGASLRINLDSISVLRPCIKKKYRTFLCNFAGWKIDAVLTYFLRLDLNRRKSDIFSTYFVWPNFDEWKSTLAMGKKLTPFWCAFFDLILIHEKLALLWRIFLIQFPMENWWNLEVIILICFFERQEFMVVLVFLFDMFLIYQQLKSFERLFSTWFCFDILFKSNFIPPWNMLYTDYFLAKFFCNS